MTEQEFLKSINCWKLIIINKPSKNIESNWHPRTIIFLKNVIISWSKRKKLRLFQFQLLYCTKRLLLRLFIDWKSYFLLNCCLAGSYLRLEIYLFDWRCVQRICSGKLQYCLEIDDIQVFLVARIRLSMMS